MIRKIRIGAQKVSLAVFILMLFALTSCQKNKATTPPKVTGPEAAVATTHYQGVGKVISLNPQRPSIEIDHENIEGLMEAMTMEFYVKDKSLLEGLKRGDLISFSIDNGVGGLVIIKITKKGS